MDRETLMSVARTSLGTKVSPKLAELLTSIVVDSVLLVQKCVGSAFPACFLPCCTLSHLLTACSSGRGEFVVLSLRAFYPLSLLMTAVVFPHTFYGHGDLVYRPTFCHTIRYVFTHWRHPHAVKIHREGKPIDPPMAEIMEMQCMHTVRIYTSP